MHPKRLLAAAAVCAPVLALDRLSKAWAEAVLRPLGGPLAAWPGVFQWRWVQNSGMAFSAFSGRSALLAAVSVLFIAAILCYLLLAPRLSRAGLAGLSLVAAGGAGNLWDRLANGCVTDLIELTFMRFAVFNVADIAVCAGAALCLIGLFASEWRAKGGRA